MYFYLSLLYHFSFVEIETTTTKPFNHTSCLSNEEVLANMQLVNCNNPSGIKVAGGLCDDDGTGCDVVLDICVSPLHSK